MVDEFKVVFPEDVINFLDQIEDEKARDKILFNIDKAKAKAKNSNGLFKKLNSDIWEFRTSFNKTQYRLFAFRDKTDKKVIIVVATHAIVKKTQKTPSKEIDKAVQIMKRYFDEKTINS